MTKTAKVIGKNNDLSRRIDIPVRTARDEIYELTTTFNRMISGLEDSSNREKQFSSDVSHELRTPIAVIKAESEFALKIRPYRGRFTRRLNTYLRTSQVYD